MNKIDQWLDQLEENGGRVTGPRKAIVELMASTEYALSPVDIYDKARERYPKLGLVTVYRTLEKLERLNLIQRVHQPCGCNAFLPQASGHQHLIICEKCGKTQFFEGDNLGHFFDQVANQFGYSIREHWLQLFGLCKECRKKI